MNYLEIKTLKIELDLYKNYFEKQENQIKFYEGIKQEKEKTLEEFKNSTTELYKIQCMNFNQCIEIIKVSSK